MTERLYYTDAYLADFESEVLSCVPSDERFEVTLAASAFYPIDAFLIDLSSLDGNNGFRLDGAGDPVSSAGDVNGDGFDDLIVGTNDLAPNGDPNSVSSYLVFGKAAEFSAAINLSNLNGNNGFRLDEGAEYDRSRYSVSSAGDVNGDGFDDLIVVVYGGDSNDSYSSTSYVMFGKASDFPSTLDLSGLDDSTGFRLEWSRHIG